MSARSSTKIPSPDALTLPPDPEGFGEADAAPVRQACCPNCARGSSEIFSAKDNRGISRDTFPYYRCGACGLIFLWPIPADLDRYYPSDYYGFPGSLEEMESAVAGERYKIEMVKQFASGGRLLEIGPGGGGFAYLAKQAGFEVSAIEMNAASCRYLADVIGVRAIHRVDSAEAILAEGTHDVIAAWHVIEHLVDPWPTVAAAAARLAPDGVLVLAAPNPASVQFRLLGRNWVHVDAPRHVQLIPVPLLKRRAAGLGLRPLLITTNDEGSLHWNRFGWEESLRIVFPSRPGRIFRPTARTLGGLFTALFSPIEESGLRGSTYTAVFQKVERT